jgi:septal ring-binding cell division protein DamX
VLRAPSAPRPANVTGQAPLSSPGAEIRRLVAAGDLAGAAGRGASFARGPGAGAYALQLVFACEEKTVKNAFQAVSSGELYLAPAKGAGNRSCYRLLWGVYPDRGAAAASAADIPAYFRRGGAPWPVALETITGP